MPIENERKFVLRDPDGTLEATLAGMAGLRRFRIRQGYLDAPGLRIRAFEEAGQDVSYVFSYKRPVGDEVVEIETAMSGADFERLWRLRREALEKVRYEIAAGDCHWDVDFFKANDRTYFVLAECEMPEGQAEPPEPPSAIATRVAHRVGLGDERFTSKKLADPVHAAAMTALVAANRVDG